MYKVYKVLVVFLFLLSPLYAGKIDPAHQAIFDRAHKICAVGGALPERQEVIQNLESLSKQDADAETTVLAKAALARLALNKFYALDDQKIFTWTQQAADLGNAIAITNLGVCYEDGTGVEKDLGKALEHYQKAAHMGYARAITNLGVCYDDGRGVAKNESKAISLYQQAADMGYAIAITYLGVCYDDGRGVAKDLGKAVKLYQQAADLGNAIAITNLGVCYEDGTGVAKNESKAISLYQQAADMGDAAAVTNLGVCYEHGIGVAKDASKAVKLYQQAADLGYARAITNLGVCYEYGIGVAKDASKAVKLYQQAADLGDARAINNLGVCYHYGIGVAKDLGKAVKLYQQGADMGFATAINNLGVCYECGTGVAKDLGKAVKLYQQGADMGDACAITNLGVCYKYGTGVAKDLGKYRQLDFINDLVNGDSDSSSSLPLNGQNYLKLACDLFGFSKNSPSTDDKDTDQSTLTQDQAVSLSAKLESALSDFNDLKQGVFDFIRPFASYDKATELDPVAVAFVPLVVSSEASVTRDLCLFPINQKTYAQLEAANYCKYTEEALTFPLTPQLQVYEISGNYYASLGHANVGESKGIIDFLYGPRGQDIWQGLKERIIAKKNDTRIDPDVIVLGMIQRRIHQKMESLIHMAGLMKGHNLPEFLDPEETKDLHQLNTQVLGKMILRPRPPSQNNDDDDSGISRS